MDFFNGIRYNPTVRQIVLTIAGVIASLGLVGSSSPLYNWIDDGLQRTQAEDLLVPGTATVNDVRTNHLYTQTEICATNQADGVSFNATGQRLLAANGVRSGSFENVSATVYKDGKQVYQGVINYNQPIDISGAKIVTVKNLSGIANFCLADAQFKK